MSPNGSGPWVDQLFPGSNWSIVVLCRSFHFQRIKEIVFATEGAEHPVLGTANLLSFAAHPVLVVEPVEWHKMSKRGL